LVGVNIDLFDVISWDIRRLSVSVIVKEKVRDLNIRITTAYGSPYEEGKQSLISELHELSLNWNGPFLIGGDINLVRCQNDKINGNVNFKWIDSFNAWIDLWALIEIGLAGRSFTWYNNQGNRIMSKIDRIFCSTDFEGMFPLGKARALPRLAVITLPLCGILVRHVLREKSSFKFEIWWLTRPDFANIVTKAWSIPRNSHESIMDSWQKKVRYFRRLAKGWSANLEASIRKI
jgi:hypothetical protein